MVKVMRKATATVGGPVQDKTFHINRGRVMKALRWLRKHKILYHDVVIAENNLSWMGDREEADITEVIGTVDDVTSRSDKEVEARDSDDDSDDSNEAILLQIPLCISTSTRTLDQLLSSHASS